MRVTQPVADELRARLGPSRESGGQLLFCCPFCRENGKGVDDKHHLYLGRTNGLWICYRCGERGNLIHLGRRLGFSVPDSGEEVAPPTDSFLREVGSLLQPSPPLPLALPCRTEPVLPGCPAWDYLMARGVDPGAVAAHRISWGEWGGAERVFVPTFERGRMVYWVARGFSFSDPEAPRYVNPGVSRQSYLFNYEIASRYPRTIVTEGVFSALAAGPSAVALFGKTATPEQLARLACTWREFIVALDGDARREALLLGSWLNSSGPTRVVDFEVGQDPASAPDFGERLERSRPYDFAEYIGEVFKDLNRHGHPTHPRG